MEVDFMMDELRKICHMEPLGEKILIVDSYYIGNQIIEAYTAKEQLVVNLHYKTVNDLALELLSSKASLQLEIAEKAVTEHLIYRILRQLKENRQLHYFNDIEMTAAFCKSMHDTIMQLRLAGFQAASLHTASFLAEAKGNDFKIILSHYEQALSERNLMDQASIFQQAIQLVSKHNKALYILQSNLQLTYLEHMFLDKLLPEKKYKLSLAKVYGVNLPENSSIESIKWGFPTPLSYIYCPDKQFEQLEQVKVYIAKTEELEIKAVFQNLKHNKASIDSSVIYYSNSEPYTAIIHQICQKLKIPVTFADGVPIVYSRPGKLVAGLLDWVQSNYHVETFILLVFEGLLSFAAPSKMRIVKLLRDLQIGWGKDRYIPIIEEALEQLKEEERNDALSTRINDLHNLKAWFRVVLGALPNPNEDISYKSLLMGIRYILSNYSEVNTDLDYIAKNELEKKVDALIPYLEDEKISLYDAVQRASDLLITSRINASGPKPGFLHAASYEDGIYNQRKFVFFVGLDNQRFPGKSMEDPLLLDSERASLQRELKLLREQSERKLYNILQAIAHCSGQVTASYCNFDVTNNRALNPSYLFLQLYRAANGNNLINFKDIQAVYTALYSENALEDFDVWASKIVDENIYSIENSLLDKFPNLLNGLHAEKMRESEQFTAYDGKVEMNQSGSLEQTFSASKLEMLAACPYAYFLREILKLKPIETVDFDANKWLDAKTRGSLLHKIFELFLKKLKEDGEKPNYLKHLELIKKIAQHAIEEERQRSAPPNERVYQNEVNDILHCCDIFLKEEEVFYTEHEPVAFEYSFGINGEKPAVLTLANGDNALVAGKIDRVDLNQAGKKHIIDYKTGSTYGYKERNAFNGGRQLQHVIYALAIEQHLQLEAGTVTESSYYFPSAKGNGERVVFKQTSTLREDGIHILTKLIEIIKQGDFSMTDDINDCRYCSYKTVCRRDSYQTETFNKKLSGLESFKEVRGYD